MSLVPIFIHVQESRTSVETHPVPPADVRVNLIIEVCLCRLYPMTGNTSSSNYFSSRYECSNMDTLQKYDQLRQILDPKFTRLGVDTSSIFYTRLVWKIMGRGLKILRTRVSDESYSLDMWLTCEVQAVMAATEIDRAGFLTRAFAGLESEIENNDRGIAAIRELRIKAMLNIVEVGGGDEETCVICLGQLEVGLEAGRMPCSHGFHTDCIRKWLRQNYICPVCRFIPTI